MKKCLSLLLSLFVFCIVLIFPFQPVSGSVNISDIRILNNKTDVVVYAVLTESFTKEMESAILAGIPTTFTFTLITYQETDWWVDKKISEITIKHIIKYDNVKQTYSVISAQDKPEAVFKDFASAKRAMSELSGVPVVPIAALTKGNEYYIKIKAKLEKYRPPSFMRYIFFFASPGDFETDWSPQQRFLY
jgi:hypothetical protein